MSTPLSAAARAAAFFDNWRIERRQSTQQHQEERESDAPPSASSIIKESIPSLPSIAVGGATSSPAIRTTPSRAKNAAPVADMAPRSATSSASKPGVKSSPASGKKNATTTRDDRDGETDSDTDDTGDSYAVRDQIVAEEPALWDPPFATTPSRPKLPARLPNSRRNRAARRSSPILGAHSSDVEDDDRQREPPKRAAKTAARDKKEQAQAKKQELEQAQKQQLEQAQKQQLEQEQEKEEQEQENDTRADAKDDKAVSQKKYSLKAISSHRPKPGEPNIFELLVRWASKSGGEAVETWEPEETLHRDAPRLLFAYWRRVGGREAHMQDPTLWYVEGVKTHRVRGQMVELHLSWVGSPELNWEREARVEDIAPLVLEEYWEEKGGRANVLGKKRKAAVGKKAGAKRARK